MAACRGMLHVPVRLIRQIIQWIIHWTLVAFTAGNTQPPGTQPACGTEAGTKAWDKAGEATAVADTTAGRQRSSGPLALPPPSGSASPCQDADPLMVVLSSLCSILTVGDHLRSTGKDLGEGVSCKVIEAEVMPSPNVRHAACPDTSDGTNLVAVKIYKELPKPRLLPFLTTSNRHHDLQEIVVLQLVQQRPDKFAAMLGMAGSPGNGPRLLVMQLYRSSLEELLAKLSGMKKQLTIDKTKLFMRQLLGCLQVMQDGSLTMGGIAGPGQRSYTILHRDIKPHNLFVMDDDNIVLGDFGTAAVDEQQQGGNTRFKHRRPAGTRFFCAPEVFVALDAAEAAEAAALAGGSDAAEAAAIFQAELAKAPEYDASCDVYSAGVTCMAMLAGGTDKLLEPFLQLEDTYSDERAFKEALQLYITEHQGRLLELHEQLSSTSAHEFFSQCCAGDPKQRRSPKELLEHVWLCGDN